MCTRNGWRSASYLIPVAILITKLIITRYTLAWQCKGFSYIFDIFSISFLIKIVARVDWWVVPLTNTCDQIVSGFFCLLSICMRKEESCSGKMWSLTKCLRSRYSDASHSVQDGLEHILGGFIIGKLHHYLTKISQFECYNKSSVV